jgi:hypothetical protein
VSADVFVNAVCFRNRPCCPKSKAETFNTLVDEASQEILYKAASEGIVQMTKGWIRMRTSQSGVGTFRSFLPAL